MEERSRRGACDAERRDSRKAGGTPQCHCWSCVSLLILFYHQSRPGSRQQCEKPATGRWTTVLQSEPGPPGDLKDFYPCCSSSKPRLKPPPGCWPRRGVSASQRREVTSLGRQSSEALWTLVGTSSCRSKERVFRDVAAHSLLWPSASLVVLNAEG